MLNPEEKPYLKMLITMKIIKELIELKTLLLLEQIEINIKKEIQIFINFF